MVIYTFRCGTDRGPKTVEIRSALGPETAHARALTLLRRAGMRVHVAIQLQTGQL